MLIPFVDVSLNVAQEPVCQSFSLKSNLNQTESKVPVKEAFVSSPKNVKFRNCEVEFLMRLA